MLLAAARDLARRVGPLDGRPWPSEHHGRVAILRDRRGVIAARNSAKGGLREERGFRVRERSSYWPRLTSASVPLAIALSLLLVASVSAQSIQKWKTPDGELFFGDRPPAGSTKVGEVGSTSRTAEPGLPEKTFAAQASHSRNEVERALKRASDRLWDIRDQLDKVENLEPKDDPEFVMSQQDAVDVAAFQAKKTETLRELKAAERKSYAAIADLWKRFDELTAKVAERYGRKSPDWWRGTLACPNCPSSDEAQEALR